VQPLALAQARHHRVERRGERARLIARDNGHAHGQVAAADAVRRVAEVNDWSRDRIGQNEAKWSRS
jgi:hypothetical protein